MSIPTPGLLSGAVRLSHRALFVAGLLLATDAPTSEAAEVTTLWQESFHYQDWGYDGVVGEMRAVSVTPDGGFCLAGLKETWRPGQVDPDDDVWVVRLDATGAVVFDRTFGDDGQQWANGISATSDGGCVVAGSKPHRRRDSWVLSLDARGSLLWDRRFGGPHTDEAMAVATTKNGDAIISSYLSPSTEDQSVLRVHRFNSDGALVWTRGSDELGITPDGRRVTAIHGGGALVTGPMRLPGAAFGYSALELDAGGVVTWSATLDIDGWPDAFVAVPGQGYALANYSSDPDPWPMVRMRRFDDAAQEQWRSEVQLFDDGVSPAAYRPYSADMALLVDGSIALVVQRDFHHYKVADPRTYTDHWLLRFDFNGRMTARHLLEGERPAEIDTVDIVRAIAAAPGGSLVMVGRTIWLWHPEAGGREDAWLRRVELP